ncbi:signal peptide-containing protein [Theileria equi strain WA]|uniref:Signal peptide-containing protein n=1 Tax=Theileria equi strain WA TaxID=1537102 RepID=L0AWR8_THEEQ|nr:signal peptide-containing protein [Theileria equi strain WA]AFZ79990.1 signal peptide-containing protein [Theileria equi strain WA]|eukprot:XP_004829656.1 signal peptide-containing protein [Theileria equi strain WA]
MNTLPVFCVACLFRLCGAGIIGKNKNSLPNPSKIKHPVDLPPQDGEVPTIAPPGPYTNPSNGSMNLSGEVPWEEEYEDNKEQVWDLANGTSYGKKNLAPGELSHGKEEKSGQTQLRQSTTGSDEPLLFNLENSEDPKGNEKKEEEEEMFKMDGDSDSEE